jgi:hypothetical protein
MTRSTPPDRRSKGLVREPATRLEEVLSVSSNHWFT